MHNFTLVVDNGHLLFFFWRNCVFSPTFHPNLPILRNCREISIRREIYFHNFFLNLAQMIVMFFYLPTVEVAMGKLEADEKVLCIELLLKVALIGPAILLPLLGPDTPDPLLADSSPWTSCPACPCCGCPAKAITPTALQKQLLNPAILCTPMGCTINLITITITITTITITTSTCKNGQCGKVKEETNVGIT